MTNPPIQALLFDVFGTCVDWRSSLVREMQKLSQDKGLNMDCAAFADAWRGLYQPSMKQVRNGTRPWTMLDILHRESLDKLVAQYDLEGLSNSELDHLNRVWHRLDPWADTVSGLARLKERFIVAPLSNGNVALLVNMAKRAGLPWDLILGAEIAGHYKPEAEAYLKASRLLGLAPNQCMMVAAHNDDLRAARQCGFNTAFVCRPTEHGSQQITDLAPAEDWDLVTDSFIALADWMCA